MSDIVEELASIIRNEVEVTVHPDEPVSYDYEVDPYRAAETIAAEIVRLRSLVEEKDEVLIALRVYFEQLDELSGSSHAGMIKMIRTALEDSSNGDT